MIMGAAIMRTRAKPLQNPPILTPENRAFSDARRRCMLASCRARRSSSPPRPSSPCPTWSPTAQGALVKGNRDADGHPQVLCSFYPGELVQPAPPGLDVASALVLSPADARALARELERAAEDAEEQ